MVSLKSLFKFSHTHHLCDPQDCVSATACANPPNAIEQEKLQRKDSTGKVLDTHYIDRDAGMQAAPRHHPNAGIGGYVDVQRRSNIGGYRNIDRVSEIGNDHAFSGVPRRGSTTYVIRTVYRADEGIQKEEEPQAAADRLR
ncbi:hypothetical protein IW140_004819 [Coemansia sp. RSA 1813]|nr:hypothetical protein EV178_004850 [Coemansia sp. RSA 1646]KAJ1766982.1 hypothetical protein LPJ74_005609 [Coemansia sp. RSA 1843]KAJ2088821.1 hypothetical protein IW138_003893 [Coemansia sp. RSA 986]KAJ2212349.1 hypothetical protein EV179_004744 [Coemansia sp. RSA 487]KAJ2566696.1 hypothetical protein IW140_004819 [Coemansia sp. RSA 1813]